jgi:hypothetical protein
MKMLCRDVSSTVQSGVINSGHHKSVLRESHPTAETVRKVRGIPPNFSWGMFKFSLRVPEDAGPILSSPAPPLAPRVAARERS